MPRSGPALGAGSTAQTVVPPSLVRTPQLLDKCLTMASPLPPSENRDGRAGCGRVVAPPSLTDTSIHPSMSTQATCSIEPGSGRACRMALLSSSLTTSAASQAAGSTMPASRRSAARCHRAAPTLAGVFGSRTTLDVLTSRAPAPQANLIQDGHAPAPCPENSDQP